MEETEQEKKKRLQKRDKYRNSTCQGCRHNYYNFPKEKSPNGDVAVSEDYSCWHMKSISRGICPFRS
jgi:hypothetical protein